jgi:hypothetical protein
MIKSRKPVIDGVDQRWATIFASMEQESLEEQDRKERERDREGDRRREQSAHSTPLRRHSHSHAKYKDEREDYDGEVDGSPIRRKKASDQHWEEQGMVDGDLADLPNTMREYDDYEREVCVCELVCVSVCVCVCVCVCECICVCVCVCVCI